MAYTRVDHMIICPALLKLQHDNFRQGEMTDTTPLLYFWTHADHLTTVR